MTPVSVPLLQQDHPSLELDAYQPPDVPINLFRHQKVLQHIYLP